MFPGLPAELLDRYLAGAASDDDRTAIEAWLRENPAHTVAVERLRDLLRQSDVAALSSAEITALVQAATSAPSSIGHDGLGTRVGTRANVRSDASASNAHGATDARPSASSARRAPHVHRSLRNAALATVGAAALIVGGAIVVRGYLTKPAAPSLTQTYATDAAEQSIIPLADGSEATLGPASTLTISSDPTNGTVATVTGEALFTVVHRSRVPFTVRTTNAVTRVLGTTFMVRRYATDRATRVMVVDGRVSVRSAHGTAAGHTGAVLTQRTLGVVDDSGGMRVTSNVSVDDYTSWTTGQLVFRQTPVGDIVADLGRAYGVDLRVADSALKEQAFTWTVSVARLSLDDALEALTTALHAHVTKSGTVLTIVPGPSRARKSHDSHISHSGETQYGR
jgi:ferric-dicitrate binding protein FerR (iron transport regulator)